MSLEGNKVSISTKRELKNKVWGANRTVNLHDLGIHYWHEDYLPSQMEPLPYLSYVRRGLTPPIDLPKYFPEGHKDHIAGWYEQNYFKLKNAGIQHLGNEFNLNMNCDFEHADLTVCMLRLSTYEVVDGSFGSHLVNNFIQDYTDNIFVDFAYMPEFEDMRWYFEGDVPLAFGSITKRPLSDFDILIVVTTYPAERLNAPFLMKHSGIPLYRWERMDESLPYKAPLVFCVGIGAFFIEGMLGDNPVKGVGQNSFFDGVLIGEGEMLDLKVFQEYIYQVKQGGMSHPDFLSFLNNDKHLGYYDPTRILFEYGDKIHQPKTFDRVLIEEPVLYKNGGNITSISLIDADKEALHVLTGVDSEEFQQIEEPNIQYMSKLGELADIAKKYRREEQPENEFRVYDVEDFGIYDVDAELDSSDEEE